eukprot:scaffold10725_cov147-Cylindrotheca_fusiformis.AAC.7
MRTAENKNVTRTLLASSSHQPLNVDDLCASSARSSTQSDPTDSLIFSNQMDMVQVGGRR